MVRRLKRARLRITLLDRRNYHLFQPLLYQVATAALSPGDIGSPIRWILRRQQNVQVLLGEVCGVDVGRRVVQLDSGELTYDVLVVATGARPACFENEEWAKHAPGLKSLDDALRIRRKVLLAFEKAERTEDPQVARRLLTFVVAGGGPTGVELAGALSEIARHALAKDFRAPLTRAQHGSSYWRPHRPFSHHFHVRFRLRPNRPSAPRASRYGKIRPYARSVPDGSMPEMSGSRPARCSGRLGS